MWIIVKTTFRTVFYRNVILDFFSLALLVLDLFSLALLFLLESMLNWSNKAAVRGINVAIPPGISILTWKEFIDFVSNLTPVLASQETCPQLSVYADKLWSDIYWISSIKNFGTPLIDKCFWNSALVIGPQNKKEHKGKISLEASIFRPLLRIKIL